MVVVALFALIGVSLASSFSMGMRVWKRAATTNLVYRKTVINLERLSRELRQGINYPDIGFFGEKESIEFAALLKGEITNVSYSYVPQEKAVFRSAVTRQEMLALENQTPARRIISGIGSAAFSYYYFDANLSQYTFSESWNYTKSGIPLAVKATLVFDDGETFEKIISIPLAQ
jgi:hypothetical protein